MKQQFSFIIFCIISMPVFAQNCPGIAVEPYTEEVSIGDTTFFTAVTKNLKHNVAYKWTVNTGNIVSGQGTARITVVTKGAKGDFITAAVTLEGLPATCAARAEGVAALSSGSQLVVSGTFTNGNELKKAVQQFIASSNFKDPDNDATAFVYLYKADNTTESSMQLFKDVIKGAFDYNKIAPNQYTIADGGSKKFNTYEIYLINKGADAPGPSK